MFDHEYFRLLSSLAATRQLTPDEDAELAKHLVDCKECSQIREEFNHLVRNQLPQAHAALLGDRPLPFELPPSAELRDKFLGRLRAEGARFTANAERPAQPLQPAVSRKWRVSPWQPVAATATLAAVLILGVWVSLNHGTSARSDAPVTAADPPKENRNGRLADDLASVRQAMELSSQELDRLRKEKQASDDLLRKLQTDLRESQSASDKLLAENQAEKSRNSALNEDDQQKDGVIANLRAQNDEVRRQRADGLAELALERQHNQELADSLDLQTTSLEREHQLESATNDVRRLMGARNLHIIDVRDMNLVGQSARPFGRVFYAEGQSMIFYAFDLPSAGATPAKYTFQAWGGQDAGSNSPRNLGTFEVDDNKQRRWVLKVNDPTLLAGIDSVFVTAESIRDIREPRGKKLLYAYIAGQPNHP